MTWKLWTAGHCHGWFHIRPQLNLGVQVTLARYMAFVSISLACFEFKAGWWRYYV